jgi:hypothetical protein
MIKQAQWNVVQSSGLRQMSPEDSTTLLQRRWHRRDEDTGVRRSLQRIRHYGLLRPDFFDSSSSTCSSFTISGFFE